MIKKRKTLEDGSPASTGHKPKKKKSVESAKIIEVPPELERQLATDRQVEMYAFRIRNEVEKLSKLTESIATAYAEYAESNDRIDNANNLHNGLANMLKLIEIQTTTKLHIKKMQTDILQTIASSTPNDELPYAIQEILAEVNVNFLDSKLVRAYGEIAKVMKEDSDLAKQMEREIKFVPSSFESELEVYEEDCGGDCEDC